MIVDNYLRISTDQAVTADALSDYSVNKKVAADFGEGRNLYMVFTITESFNNTTSLNFTVVTSATAALGSTTTIAATGAQTTLTAGSQYVVALPPQIGSLSQQYLGAYYDITTSGTVTTGKITTDIVTDIQDGKKFYASGFSVV